MLTAAHCLLPGATYKLIDFDAARQPVLKDIADIARHPDFDVNAVLRHRVTADVALLKLAAPVKVAPALLGRPAARSPSVTASWSPDMASPCAATARAAVPCEPQR